MNKDTQQKVEEIVERLMKSWSLCDLQYNSEYDKVENELREALTTLLQETEKAERERIKEWANSQIKVASISHKNSDNPDIFAGHITGMELLLDYLTPSK